MFTNEEQRQLFNQEAQGWAKHTKALLIQRINQLDLVSQIELLHRVRREEGRKALPETLRTNINKNFGTVEAIRFSFYITGFWWDRGVVAETPITLAGSTERTPKPWIDFVLEDQTEVLADILAERFGDDIVETIKFTRQ